MFTFKLVDFTNRIKQAYTHDNVLSFDVVKYLTIDYNGINIQVYVENELDCDTNHFDRKLEWKVYPYDDQEYTLGTDLRIFLDFQEESTLEYKNINKIIQLNDFQKTLDFCKELKSFINKNINNFEEIVSVFPQDIEEFKEKFKDKLDDNYVCF